MLKISGHLRCEAARYLHSPGSTAGSNLASAKSRQQHVLHAMFSVPLSPGQQIKQNAAGAAATGQRAWLRRPTSLAAPSSSSTTSLVDQQVDHVGNDEGKSDGFYNAAALNANLTVLATNFARFLSGDGSGNDFLDIDDDDDYVDDEERKARRRCARPLLWKLPTGDGASCLALRDHRIAALVERRFPHHREERRRRRRWRAQPIQYVKYLTYSTSHRPKRMTRSLQEGCATNWNRWWTFRRELQSGSVYESNGRACRKFIDRSSSYCFLCNEPVTNLASHTSYWDHISRIVALKLMTVYQRPGWTPERVLVDSTERFGAAMMYKVVPGWTTSPWTHLRFHLAGKLSERHREIADHIGALGSSSVLCPLERDPDARKRWQELHALLVQLVHWNVLKYCFHEERIGAQNQGERCFRSDVSKLCNTIVPLLSPQAMTRFQQRIWGRKTLELLFDLLDLGRTVQVAILKVPEKQMAVTKEAKASVMRQMLYELHCATDMKQQVDVVKEMEEWRTTERRDTEKITDGAAAAPPPPPNVVQMLAEVALHKIAFELMAIRTSILMDELGNGMWATLGLPAFEDMMDGSVDLLA